MHARDIAKVVEVHLAAFPRFFLSSLGSNFLTELYSGLLVDPSGIALVVEKGGKVQGFVAGTYNPRGFYKRLLRRRWWRFALASILPAMTNPEIIPRLLRAFSRGRQEDVRENCATLMSLAVSPSSQRSGLGRLLVQAFLVEAGKRGAVMVNLTTDQLENERVNSFYKELGFELNSTFRTPEGRSMNEYLLEICST